MAKQATELPRQVRSQTEFGTRGRRSRSFEDKRVPKLELGNEESRLTSGLRPLGQDSRPDYFFAAASCFAFVWKIASQSLPSFFQTVPQLYVPELSFPFDVPWMTHL